MGDLRKWLLDQADNERDRLTSQALVETFPGTSAGRALPSSPLDQRPGKGVPSVNIVRNPGAGEMIALTGTVTIDGAGSGVVGQMDTIQTQAGLPSVETAGDTVTLRKAIWLTEADIRFTDGYRGGATVEVTLGGAAIGSTWDDSYRWGRWVDTMAFPVTAASAFDVKVTPTDGQEHTAEVTVRVTLVEKLRTIAETVSPAPATSQAQASHDVGNFGTQTLVHGAPSTGVAVGDLLVVAITGVSLEGTHGGSGGAGTLTVDSDWTVAEQLQHPTYTRQHFAVAWKIADAADAAGTASYSHTLSGVQVHYGSCCCTVIPQSNGTAVSAAVSAMSTGAAITLTPPAGDWCLAVAMMKERAGTDDAANISVTSPAAAVELASHGWAGYSPQESSTARRGVQWIYSTSASADVTATFAGTSQPVGALVLLGVTGGSGGG